MTPVALRLNNFLSYGEAGDAALSFEAFHVACLSGGNGQGKSALLDAVTYALWGMARKSSTLRKPDADLLRRGARDMWVELEFDAQEQRYRVRRSYGESASGKTSKSELNLFAYNPDAQAWRPLTSTDQRETQARIDEVVGLDYDTFTNASFLLQGQSDAFTRRKPSERKEVLARILNLSRYDRLAERAGERAREARKEAEFLERERSRLEEQVARAERVEAERDELDARRQALAGEAAQAEARAQEAVAEAERLRAQGAERDALAADRAAARTRAERARQDAGELSASLSAADALIGRADAIERDADAHGHAQREQARLAEQAARASQLDREASTLEREIDRLTSEHRQAVAAARTELDNLQARIAEADAALGGREEAARALERAERAASERDRLLELERRAAALDEHRREAERSVEREGDRLETQARQADAEADRLAEQVDAEPSLERQLADAERAEAQKGELEERQAHVQQQGEAARDRRASLEARLQAFDRELAALDARRTAIRETQDATCPTCGTDLTPEHRRHVDADLRAEQQKLERQRDELAEQAGRLDAEIRSFRERFKEARDRSRRAADAALSATRLREQRKSLHEKRARIGQLRGQAAAARTQLGGDTYAAEARRAADAARREREELDFDPDRLARAREAAGALAGCRKQAAELDALAARRSGLTDRSEQTRQRLATLEDAGDVLGDRPDRLQALRAERAELDYDPDRARHVAATLERLAEAPRLRDRLATAQSARPDLAARLDRARQDGEEAAQQLAALDERLRAFETLAADLAAAEQARTHAQRAAADTRTRLTETESRLAVVRADLERISQDRAALAQNRAAAREADEQYALYRHLRTAFGPKGIQSLIIEQTLPEIEERANGLLERLTAGAMTVRLETLRDKQGGGTAETLDIVIADGSGALRPYETFSGGEAFRVNFALRIALSQLLADRAGVQVRTLVIDEGFGTQDAEGIERLIGAINEVQDDFDKILIVTHLDEMKDAFPVRIQVQKEPGRGSTFELVGV